MIVQPPVLIELNWSHDESRSKIFESVRDAIKLSILAAERGSFAYLATGASLGAWKESESRDLFEEGDVEPSELWQRELDPPGPNGGKTVGEDLVRGSPSQGGPREAPRQIAVTGVADLCYWNEYLLKVVRVAGSAEMREW